MKIKNIVSSNSNRFNYPNKLHYIYIYCIYIYIERVEWIFYIIVTIQRLLSYYALFFTTGKIIIIIKGTFLVLCLKFESVFSGK